MKDALKLVASAITVLAVVVFAIMRFGRESSNPPPTQNTSVSPSSSPLASSPQPEPQPAATKTNSVESDLEFEPIQDQMAEAYYYATRTIREQLKDPSDAKFSSLGWDDDAKIVPYGYHQWLCEGWMDAFNSFGAKERLPWGAYVFLSKVAVRVDYFEIGQQSYGQLPARIPFPVAPPSPEEIAAAKAKVQTAKKSAEVKALKYDEDLAAKGDTFGLLRMGERYRDGDGVTNNPALARDYLQRAAKAGDPTAADELKDLLVK